MAKNEFYVASSAVPVSNQEAFSYHERPGALQRLIPPWESVTVEKSDESLEPGSQVILKNRLFGISLRWLAEHTSYDPPKSFADTQLKGPFKRWDHVHLFQPTGHDHCVIRDELTYRLPLGVLGKLFGGGLVAQKIESMFSYRHRIVNDDLDLFQSHDKAPMSIAISGSTGLMGRQLTSMLGLFGHDVKRLVRKPGVEQDVAIWTDDAAETSKLEGVDAIVHLAGKPIAEGRWTDAQKKELRDSRVIKTRQLCEKLASLDRKPKVLVCASATGFYGERGDEELTEDSKPGDTFLADICQEWEQATGPAIDAGIRVVNARFGIVLSPRGGALKKCLLPAKLMGGKLGSGRQFWSWIALDDAIGALYHAIQTSELKGPVNFVSPEPLRNSDFARTLGSVLSRPAIFPAPAFALRMALGEMADALLLCSAHVKPNRLTESGYNFRFSNLNSALRYCLGFDRLESAE